MKCKHVHSKKRRHLKTHRYLGDNVKTKYLSVLSKLPKTLLINKKKPDSNTRPKVKMKCQIMTENLLKYPLRKFSERNFICSVYNYTHIRHFIISTHDCLKTALLKSPMRNFSN